MQSNQIPYRTCNKNPLDLKQYVPTFRRKYYPNISIPKNNVIYVSEIFWSESTTPQGEEIQNLLSDTFPLHNQKYSKRSQ